MTPTKTSHTCPCCSGKPYPLCCEPYINGTIVPPTPEALMRSRYTAYTQANIDYIFSTMRDHALRNANREDALSWAKRLSWTGLEVKSSTIDGNVGYVEFIANFIENNAPQKLHERSRFILEGKHWYYVDGVHESEV